MQKSPMKIEAKIHPGSSKRRVEYRDGTYHVYTHARPVEGKANADAVKLVAEYMGVNRSSVSLIRGERSKTKLFEIKQKV